MHRCNQTQGMTIFEHGLMVADYFTDLYNHIMFNDSLKFQWDLPDNFVEFIKSNADKIAPLELLQTYAIYHDCGKPFCMTIDEEGRKHFPNHAQMSYETWMQCTNDEQIGWYILHDMDYHAGKSDCIDALIKDSRALDILLMAYSEIHANASMFGGIDSTSFKIKRKKLDKIFKKLSA